MEEKKISIVIPTYNEQDSISELYLEIKQVMQSNNLSYEIIFIDDGSTDGTFKVMEELYNDNQGVKVIRFRTNFGKSAALAAGFKTAIGKIIITMDADLQDDPQEIPALINKINEGYDLVSGWKQKRNDPITKTIPSRAFNFMVRMLTGVKLHDINCGIKAYRSTVIKEIDVYGDLHRFLPVIASNKGFKVTEIKVQHHARKYGKTKYGIKRFVEGILDLLTVLLLTRYVKKPSHFFGSFGLLFFSIGFIADFYVTLLKFITGSTQGRIPLLIFGVLMIVVGVQLISLGLLSEIIIQKDKKHEYLIKKVLYK
ncbi:glycosyltransferase family 2 protein [Patescibacteria group bacterium]|nr:glycosyltransferase family 2 protein [Patescibacteria group bacterium]